jgi:glycosyltransferase involved in cell wall biosynthesis
MEVEAALIHVTLPVYNEQHTIGVLLWRIREMFTELNRDFRILVVNDGSTDRTAEVLEPYQRVLPLEVFTNETRQGYAASIERLIREVVRRSEYPKRDGVLVMQGDFTDGPEMIPSLLKRFQGGADLVAVRATGVKEAPRPVRLARLGAGFLTRSIPATSSVDDPYIGYRLFRVVALQRLLRDLSESNGKLLHHEGWAANVELLAVAAPHLRRVDQIEVEIDYSRRYRDSRFRAMAELWALYRASRDRRILSIGAPGAAET